MLNHTRSLVFPQLPSQPPQSCHNHAMRLDLLMYHISHVEILIILPFKQSDEIDAINLSETSERICVGRPLGDGMKG